MVLLFVVILTVVIICATYLSAETNPAQTKSAQAEVAAGADMIVDIFAWPPLCNDRKAHPLLPRPGEFRPESFDMAVGVASVDSDEFARRRAAQRDSWFSYRDVATRDKGFRGRMFVEYYVGRAFENYYQFSVDLVNESSRYGDILAMEIKEVQRKAKTGLFFQAYGMAPEIIMSFKSLAYYCYAEKTYVNAKFVVKSDDDQFVRVPMIMATMDALPARGALWARLTAVRPMRTVQYRICGASGMWIAMTRDVLHALNAMPDIQTYASVVADGAWVRALSDPSITINSIYRYTSLWAEDITPAVAFYNLYGRGNPKHRINLGYDVTYFTEAPCRLQDNNQSTTEWLRYLVNPASTIIHHATYQEQQHYRQLYPEDLVYPVEFAKIAGNRTCAGAPVMTNGQLCSQVVTGKADERLPITGWTWPL